MGQPSKAGPTPSARSSNSPRVAPLATVYNFCSVGACLDGQYPIGGLVPALMGDLYGTTWEGGGITGDLYSIGTVFKITPAGALTTLHAFCATGDCRTAHIPLAPVLASANGDLYGTTLGGGLYNCNDCFPEYPGCGTIFKIAPNGAFTTLYNFCSQANCADGMQPSAPLIRGSNGDIYGTTAHGGAYGDYGTVFQLSSNGLTALYRLLAPKADAPTGGHLLR